MSEGALAARHAPARTVLTGGAHLALVSALVARQLAAGDRVIAAGAVPADREHLRTLIGAALSRLGTAAPPVETCLARLTVLSDVDEAAAPAVVVATGEPGAPDLIDEVWCLPSGPGGAEPRRGMRIDTAATRAFLRVARARAARQFWYVGPAHPGRGPIADGYRAIEAEVELRNSTPGPPHLLVRTAPAIIEPVLGTDPDGSHHTGLAHLLDTIGWLAAHVDRRFGGYFRHEPMRLPAPPDARIEVVDAQRGAQSLMDLAAATGTADRGHRGVLLAQSIGVADLAGNVGAAYQVNLVVTSDEAALNAVDRLLRDRLGGVRGLLVPGPPPDRRRGISGPEQRALAEAFRIARQRPPLPDVPTPRTVASEPSGSTVRDAPPLVIVNALGQGDGYWALLMDRLAGSRRVILWTPPGADAGGRVASFDDHIEDLDALLRAQRTGRCHMLGWCTGAKTVLAHHRLRPASIVSIVLLSPAFKHPARPTELDTPYEEQLEALSALLAARPGTAMRVLRMFDGQLFGAGIDPERVGSALATEVLALPDPELAAQRRIPFASQESLLTYAEQLRDFWSHDAIADAASVRVPALIVAGEQDRIVSGDGLRAAMRYFSAATTLEHEVIPGGTHYSMYDRPDRLAEIVSDFIRRAECR